VVRWLLNHLPGGLLLLLIVGTTVAIGAAAEWLQAHRRRDRPPRSNEMLSVTVEFVGLAYAILIGFVIVALWQDQSEARQAVADEASSLKDIVTLSEATPASVGVPIEQAVAAYSRETADHEWKLLRTGARSERAHAAGDEILATIARVDTSSELAKTLQASMIDSFKDFRDVRSRRTGLANVRLAGELWLLVILASVTLVLLVAAFEGEGKWHIGATLIIAATIGTVMFVIVALSYPFSGAVSVSSQPFIDLARTLPG
jgi:hypothetical protein